MEEDIPNKDEEFARLKAQLEAVESWVALASTNAKDESQDDVWEQNCQQGLSSDGRGVCRDRDGDASHQLQPRSHS
jgi:hypothetical protein